MERTVTARSATATATASATTAPALPAPVDWRALGLRIVPLARHAVWLAALFVVLGAWVQIRLDVQQLRQDLDRSGRAHREATVLNDRLRLETDARRRAVAVQAIAGRLALSQQAAIVRVPTVE